MTNSDPHLVYSPLSGRHRFDGLDFDVQIYRLDFYPIWALEIVTDKGVSLIWKELFETDYEALEAFENIPGEDCMVYLLGHAELETMQ